MWLNRAFVTTRLPTVGGRDLEAVSDGLINGVHRRSIYDGCRHVFDLVGDRKGASLVKYTKIRTASGRLTYWTETLQFSSLKEAATYLINRF